MSVETFPKLSFHCDMIVFCDCFTCAALVRCFPITLQLCSVIPIKRGTLGGLVFLH